MPLNGGSIRSSQSFLTRRSNQQTARIRQLTRELSEVQTRIDGRLVDYHRECEEAAGLVNRAAALTNRLKRVREKLNLAFSIRRRMDHIEGAMSSTNPPATRTRSLATQANPPSSSSSSSRARLHHPASPGALATPPSAGAIEAEYENLRRIRSIIGEFEPSYSLGGGGGGSIEDVAHLIEESEALPGLGIHDDCEPAAYDRLPVFQDNLDRFIDSCPQEYLCPITCSVMRYPVETSDGHCYEKCAIEEWFRSFETTGNPPTSPLTNLMLENTHLTPAYELREKIQAWGAEAQAAHGTPPAPSPQAVAASPGRRGGAPPNGLSQSLVFHGGAPLQQQARGVAGGGGGGALSPVGGGVPDSRRGGAASPDCIPRDAPIWSSSELTEDELLSDPELRDIIAQYDRRQLRGAVGGGSSSSSSPQQPAAPVGAAGRAGRRPGRGGSGGSRADDDGPALADIPPERAGRGGGVGGEARQTHWSSSVVPDHEPGAAELNALHDMSLADSDEDSGATGGAKPSRALSVRGAAAAATSTSRHAAVPGRTRPGARAAGGGGGTVAPMRLAQGMPRRASLRTVMPSVSSVLRRSSSLNVRTHRHRR